MRASGTPRVVNPVYAAKPRSASAPERRITTARIAAQHVPRGTGREGAVRMEVVLRIGLDFGGSCAVHAVLCATCRSDRAPSLGELRLQAGVT